MQRPHHLKTKMFCCCSAVPEAMASYDNAAVQEIPVSTELLREAQRYRTVRTVQQWPVVTNSANTVLDGYHSLKVSLRR